MVTTVHQISKYGPIFKGGIETEAENIKHVLLEQGYFVNMLYFSSKSDTPKVTQSSNLVERVCRTQFKIFNQPVSMQYIVEILKIKTRDIVHLHLPNYVAMIACCLLPADTKIIVHWHSDVIDHRMLRLLLYPAEKILLKRANKILCTSQEYADHSSSLKDYLNKVEILPIASECVAKINNRSIRYNEDLKILNVGRLVKYKNQRFLVEVIKLLPTRYKLEIVGSGKLKNNILDKIDSAGLSARIKISSGLTKKQLHKKYLDSDVFALSSNSRAEAYGVVLVEALSFSLPIVSLKIMGSGVSFVNKDGFSGLHSAIDCPLGMAVKIMRVTKDDKSYRDFSTNAMDHYSSHFTPELHQAIVARIYEGL
jgi:glycosyltransferase involved in cell wall biosynthesis